MLSDSEHYRSNSAGLERSAKDRSDPCAGHFEPREACFISPEIRFEPREARFISPEVRFKSCEARFTSREARIEPHEIRLESRKIVNESPDLMAISSASKSEQMMPMEFRMNQTPVKIRGECL